ncbi:MAG: hypothetical protein H6806_06830 [Planctomycetes bacterium]|nr:hypothetical protein [Planctomycetota bacterium]MCB9829457.1 hypothetical protein [Planctomycetota bacterium]MCB9900165.1 hypothetical protein [Planctomycetota bacterium]
MATPAGERDPAPAFDMSRFRTRPLAGREHRVARGALAGLVTPGDSLGAFLDALPDILQVRALRGLAAAIAASSARGAPVLWGLGGHVIKTGLAPVLVDLMQRGFAHGFVLNGAAAIHDAEMAMNGSTSEDVAAGLFDGTYGTADETGRWFAAGAARAAREGIGLGTALARELAASCPDAAGRSLLVAAARDDVPVTVHVAIGTDTVHMHPACDGAALGAGTHRDFLRLATLVEGLDGGAYVNLGSAVVLPEVFMKAVAIAHNARSAEQGADAPPLSITTGNLDMLRHYRPRVNVLQRPAAQGYELTGPHEILVPLLRAAVLHAAEVGA